MKRSSILLIGSGLLIGFIAGTTIGGHHASKSIPSGTDAPQQVEQSEEGTATSSKAESRRHGSNDLLVQTQAELEAAQERLRAFEKSAAHYEWLKKNGMQTYGLMFEENAFTPQPQLLEFMGLNEAESEQLRTMADTAKQAVQDWELANAQCIADTPTNCVYELPPLPTEYKEGFLQNLATLFDPADMETMNPIVDKLYDRLASKRTASVTYVSEEDYLQRMGPRYRLPENTTYSGMLELKVVRYDENGNQRGTTSTMCSVDQMNVEYGLQARWAHLFQYSGDAK